LLASADKFEIDIEGTGAHAAFPDQGIDPILIASHIVVALQSIVARNTDPLESVVVTVSQINAGTAFNIIPQTAKLIGTVRALNPDVRAHTLERIVHISTHVAEGLGGRAEVHIDPNGFPVTFNDTQATQMVQTIATETLKNDIELAETPPIMGSEDFAFYAQHVPAAFFFLGLKPPHQNTYPSVHQSDFDFADGAIPYGIKMHVEIARNFARTWPT
ncbi:MAG: amidohydrolase, partial [Candidatus Latescibacteria bacterium]|nr:amidohydrolase [Candidatus Latescibacterota bacterium]